MQEGAEIICCGSVTCWRPRLSEFTNQRGPSAPSAEQRPLGPAPLRWLDQWEAADGRLAAGDSCEGGIQEKSREASRTAVSRLVSSCEGVQDAVCRHEDGFCEVIAGTEARGGLLEGRNASRRSFFRTGEVGGNGPRSVVWANGS